MLTVAAAALDEVRGHPVRGSELERVARSRFFRSGATALGAGRRASHPPKRRSVPSSGWWAGVEPRLTNRKEPHKALVVPRSCAHFLSYLVLSYLACPNCANAAAPTAPGDYRSRRLPPARPETVMQAVTDEQAITKSSDYVVLHEGPLDKPA